MYVTLTLITDFSYLELVNYFKLAFISISMNERETSYKKKQFEKEFWKCTFPGKGCFMSLLTYKVL